MSTFARHSRQNCQQRRPKTGANGNDHTWQAAGANGHCCKRFVSLDRLLFLSVAHSESKTSISKRGVLEDIEVKCRVWNFPAQFSLENLRNCMELHVFFCDFWREILKHRYRHLLRAYREEVKVIRRFFIEILLTNLFNIIQVRSSAGLWKS